MKNIYIFGKGVILTCVFLFLISFVICGLLMISGKEVYINNIFMYISLSTEGFDLILKPLMLGISGVIGGLIYMLTSKESTSSKIDIYF